MICHGWYPCFEAEKLPASFSSRIIKTLLREELKFEGLIMTDDLDMGAIYNEYSLEDTIRLALAAGNDLAMICHRVDGDRRSARGDQPTADRGCSTRRWKASRASKHACRLPTAFSESLFDNLTTKCGICASPFSAKSARPSAVRKTANVRRSRHIEGWRRDVSRERSARDLIDAATRSP